MSDMREWPDLSDCACGGRPIRNSAALGPELHYITCTVYRRTEHSGEGCARRSAGLTRAEAAAGWNALQAEAWRPIGVEGETKQGDEQPELDSFVLDRNGVREWTPNPPLASGELHSHVWTGDAEKPTRLEVTAPPTEQPGITARVTEVSTGVVHTLEATETAPGEYKVEIPDLPASPRRTHREQR